jgi:hypothetical protein
VCCAFGAGSALLFLGDERLVVGWFDETEVALFSWFGMGVDFCFLHESDTMKDEERRFFLASLLATAID